MAVNDSTLSQAPPPLGKLPYFELCEKSGRYRARRTLTPEQIIRAAKAALSHRCARGAPMKSLKVAADCLAVHYSERKAEVFTCLFLDNRHRLISAEDLFFGTIAAATVYPREIARRCLELNAGAVILAQNHPSGSIDPSAADLWITQRIKEVLSFLDVRVLDHLIIGGGNAYGFAENGTL